MKGWKLFAHSVGLLFRNWRVAAKVSVVPFAISAAVQATVGPLAQGDQAAINAAMASGSFPWMQMAVVFVALATTNAWMAVGWHRYVLLNEEPQSFASMKLGRVGAYVMAGLALFILLIVGGGVGGGIIGGIIGVVGAALGMSNNGGLLMAAIVICVVVPIFVWAIRVTVILPGYALQSDVGLFSGWSATKGATIDVGIAAVFAYGLQFLMGWLVSLVFTEYPQTLFWANIALQWPLALLLISILTTFYGHYVQQRQLT